MHIASAVQKQTIWHECQCLNTDRLCQLRRPNSDSCAAERTDQGRPYHAKYSFALRTKPVIMIVKCDMRRRGDKTHHSSHRWHRPPSKPFQPIEQCFASFRRPHFIITFNSLTWPRSLSFRYRSSLLSFIFHDILFGWRLTLNTTDNRPVRSESPSQKPASFANPCFCLLFIYYFFSVFCFRCWSPSSCAQIHIHQNWISLASTNNKNCIV